MKPRGPQCLRKVTNSMLIGPKPRYSSPSCLTVANPKVILMLGFPPPFVTPPRWTVLLEVFPACAHPPRRASKAHGASPEGWKLRGQKKLHPTLPVTAISWLKSRLPIKFVNTEDRQLSSHGHFVTSTCTLQQRKRSTFLLAKLRLFWS